MIGRGAMGNPWLFRTLAALERGEPDPGPPSLAERARRLAPARRRWSSSTAPRRCACTSCARRWPGTRAVCYARLGAAPARVDRRRSGGAARAGRGVLRRAASAARGGAGDAALATTPADPVAKSDAPRNSRRDGDAALEADGDRALAAS